MLLKNPAAALFAAVILTFGFVLGYYFAGSDAEKIVDKCIDKNGIVVAREKVESELTSGGAYKIAFSEAGQWSSDAYLSEIVLSSDKFDANGLSNGWKFIFYSKTKNKLYEVLIKDGESRGGQEKNNEDKKAPQTMKGELADSSVLAKSFFGLYPSDTAIISLKMYYSTSAKKFIWTVFFPKGSHTIDAEA